MKRYLIGCLTLLLSANAASWADQDGPFTISSMRVGAQGVYVALSPAPAACGGGSQYRMHAVVSPSNAAYKELTSSLLSAYIAGKKIRTIWVTGNQCSNASILTLDMIELQHQ
ncbi:hypothetical protein FHS09_000703 [Microbulbifer rhizosphaerae]|uniref:Uncharacterized protein n=1 Tax=Microbulbifer rhizosphaerae TaxID=1562603 RepID=A0A7W4W900_9GAMM|nr:hypothetical protein [Microbulbifer rhizosphaerae]